MKKLAGFLGRLAYYTGAGLLCASMLGGSYLYFMTDAGFVRWAQAQGFSIPDSSTWIGKMIFRLGANATTPTVVGGTLLVGSTDSMGQITTTGITTVTLTFGSAWLTTPSCRVQNKSATTLGIVWSESTTALTIAQGSGWVSGNVLTYACYGIGG